LQSQNLSKYAFYKLRDVAIEDIYEAQKNGVPVEKIYKKGIDIHFEKKCKKMPKMGLIEQISNVVMVFFVLFSALSLFVYLYHFLVKDINYSQGIYLHLSIEYFRNMIIYGFLGAIISVFLQKIDKQRKWIQASIIGSIGVICFILTIALQEKITSLLKLNMLIIIPCFIVLSVIGYFVNDLISKNKCKAIEVSEND
jgi:hypothetical protein